MKIEYIRKAYAVPAKIQGRIKYEGKLGTIVGESHGRLRIKLDGERVTGNYHPTYHIEYLETES